MSGGHYSSGGGVVLVISGGGGHTSAILSLWLLHNTRPFRSTLRALALTSLLRPPPPPPLVGDFSSFLLSIALFSSLTLVVVALLHWRRPVWLHDVSVVVAGGRSRRRRRWSVVMRGRGAFLRCAPAAAAPNTNTHTHTHTQRTNSLALIAAANTLECCVSTFPSFCFYFAQLSSLFLPLPPLLLDSSILPLLLLLQFSKSGKALWLFCTARNLRLLLLLLLPILPILTARVRLFRWPPLLSGGDFPEAILCRC